MIRMMYEDMQNLQNSGVTGSDIRVFSLVCQQLASSAAEAGGAGNNLIIVFTCAGLLVFRISEISLVAAILHQFDCLFSERCLRVCHCNCSFDSIY